MADELDRRAGRSGTWQPPEQPRVRQKSGLSGRPLSPVQYAVAILVQYPELADQVERSRLDVPGEVKGVGFLAHLIDFCREKPNVSTALLLEHWRDTPEGRFLSELATRDLAGGVEQLEPALVEVLQRIEGQLVRARVGRLQKIQASDGLTPEQADELREMLSKRVSGASG